jgi:hypothetical protein
MSILDGGEWSALRPGRFTSGERVHSTHWIGSWMGLGTGLDAVEKRKLSSPCRESNSNSPLVSRYPDWVIPASVWYTLRHKLILLLIQRHWIDWVQAGGPGRWNLFFRHNVQNISGVYSGLCVMGTRNTFLGDKSGRSLMLNIHFHVLPLPMLMFV